MQNIFDGILKAFQLLIQGDPEVLRITLLSLELSGAATLISLILGLPLGTFLALSRFPTRRFWITLVNTGMALPPVVIGLVVSIFLWRSGPLGFLHLIYTPGAIVIAQVLIAFPMAAGLTLSALLQLDPRLQTQLLGLGASKIQMVFALWKESRMALVAALIAAFGSVISEVGASMMVGGNLEGSTRVLTTAIVLETSRGLFVSAIALSIILLGLAFLVNLALTLLQQRRK
ncbi:MAG: ABC transporter permease [Chloroflexi bacterium]|nr:ABC transporter permease [Chloroflexota bacterium]